MSGFAAGLAQGAEAGISLGLRQNAQQLETRRLDMQQKQDDQEQAMRLNAADRQKAQDALGALDAQDAEIAKSASNEPYGAFSDPTVRQRYAEDLQKTQAARQTIHAHLGGAEALSFARGAEKTAADLASGNKDYNHLTPEEASHFVTYHTGRPASDFIDTPGTKAPVGLAFDELHQGFQQLPKDNGAMLLGAVNKLAGHELQHLVGQTSYDGSSKIINAEFAPPVPHPDSPEHAMLTAKLTLQRPDGSTTEQHVPIMDDHGHIVAHPEDSADATVKNFKMDDLFHHLGALETFYKGVNADPEMKNKLLQGYMDGHEDYAQEQMRVIRQAGGDPAKLMPKGKLIFGPDGSVVGEAAPGQETAFLPQGLAVQNARGNTALEVAQLRAAEAERLAAERAGAGAGKGTVLQQVTGDDGKSFMAWVNPQTHSIERADGITSASKPGGGLARSADALAAQRYVQEHPDATAEQIAGFASDQREIAKAKRDFGSGPKGDAVRFGDNVMSHLQQLKEASTALNNGNIPAFNSIANAFATATGQPAPTTLQAFAGIVGPELEKALITTGGSAGERTEAKKLYNLAAAPAQMAGTIDAQSGLLGTQLFDLGKQWSRSTKQGQLDPQAFADEFQLNPHTRQSLFSAVSREKPAKGGLGGEAPKTKGAPAGGKTYSKAEVQAAADRNGIPYAEMVKRVEAANHTVQ
jgi:hypothetical protein